MSIKLTNPNEPAYPVSDPSDYLGLTKREAFAMAAMQGLLANESTGNRSMGLISELAITQADDLLAKLSEPSP